jgi:argininosuccinate lyase
MLMAQEIIKPEDAQSIVSGLNEIYSDIENGKLKINPRSEDIHSFVEAELGNRIGKIAKFLHTARSQNDQVALDF